MNGLFLPLLLALVVSVAWFISPVITKRKTNTGNWYYTFPLVIVFLSLAGIAMLMSMDILWILGLLVLAFVWLVRAIVLRSQYREFQVSDD